jgi:hypothetical protein
MGAVDRRILDMAGVNLAAPTTIAEVMVVAKAAAGACLPHTTSR